MRRKIQMKIRSYERRQGKKRETILGTEDLSDCPGDKLEAYLEYLQKPEGEKKQATRDKRKQSRAGKIPDTLVDISKNDQQFIKAVAEKYDVQADVMFRKFYSIGGYEKYNIDMTNEKVFSDLATLLFVDMLIGYGGGKSIFERKVIDNLPESESERKSIQTVDADKTSADEAQQQDQTDSNKLVSEKGQDSNAKTAILPIRCLRCQAYTEHSEKEYNNHEDWRLFVCDKCGLKSYVPQI